MKNQFDKFTPYELSMIQSFATNAIITTRESDRYTALINATLSMLYAKGYLTHPDDTHLVKKLRKRFSTHNVYTIHGEPSVDVIDQILKFIYELDVVIIKDETRSATFRSPHVDRSDEDVVPQKKPWVM